MITPPALRQGDVIGLAATARKISDDELRPAIEILQSWGFTVKKAPGLTGSFHQFSGTDEERLRGFQSLIDDREVKAILCVRGGYGSVRIIDQLDFSALKDHPKWIGGYSDVTVLLNKLSLLGIESLHCTMPVNFNTNTPAAMASLRKALSGEKLRYEVDTHPYNRQGSARGILTGGNLSMLYSQLGSSTALDAEGAILFLEDLDEYLYHIDRMMHNLRRNGYFENLAGVVVGSMSEMNDNTVPFGFTAEEIVRDHLSHYKFPVCFDFPAGHQPDNRSLIFGREVMFDVGKKVILDFNG